MSLSPVCDVCNEPLNVAGALLFSPPMQSKVMKFHVCVACWAKKVKKLIHRKRIREDNFW